MIQNLLEIEVSDRTLQNPQGTDPIGMSIYLNLEEAKKIQRQIEEFIDLARGPQVFVLFMKNEKEVIHLSEHDPNNYSLSYLRFFVPLRLAGRSKEWKENITCCLNVLEENKNIKQIKLNKDGNKYLAFKNDNLKYKFKIGKEFVYVGKLFKELKIEQNQKFLELIPRFDVSEVIIVGPHPYE